MTNFYQGSEPPMGSDSHSAIRFLFPPFARGRRPRHAYSMGVRGRGVLSSPLLSIRRLTLPSDGLSNSPRQWRRTNEALRGDVTWPGHLFVRLFAYYYYMLLQNWLNLKVTFRVCRYLVRKGVLQVPVEMVAKSNVERGHLLTTLLSHRCPTFLSLPSFPFLLEFEVAKTESVITAATARTMTATPLKSRSPSRSIVACDVMDGWIEGTRIGICAML